MEKTYSFLKECGTYFLATADGDQPRVRPFGTIHMYEGKLYFQTGRSKDVYKQMITNPKVELSAFMKGKWIRVACTVVEDDRLEPHESLLNEYPDLKALYKAGDGNSTIFYLKDATSTIASFTEEPVVEKF